MEISIEALKKRYQYEHPRDLIGKGGFADVYKAYDTEDQIWVALKFYRGDWSSKYNVNNEIRRIKKYRHENLIEHIEAYEVISGHDIHGEPIRYQVGILAFANAGPLTEFMKNNPPQQVMGVLIEDVMEGLRYLHSKNIVHRDLKPHNILLFSDGERLTAKIADFGIARLLDGSDATSSHVIGTIEYMSPEHFAPNLYGLNGKLGINADLWAIGVMIFEMYTGKVPFGRRSSGNTQQEIIAGILTGPLPEDEVNDIPQPYQDIVRRCLVRNANERAQSIDDLRLNEVKQTNAAQGHSLKAHEKEAAQRATEQEAVRQDREVEAATISDPKKKIPAPETPKADALPVSKETVPKADAPSPDTVDKDAGDTVTMKLGNTLPPPKPTIDAAEGATVTMKADPALKKPPVPAPPPPETTGTGSDELTVTIKHRNQPPPVEKKRPAETRPPQLDRPPAAPAKNAEDSAATPPAKRQSGNRLAVAVLSIALALAGAWVWFFMGKKPAPTAPTTAPADSTRTVTASPQSLTKSSVSTEPVTRSAVTTTKEPERIAPEIKTPPESTPTIKVYEGLAIKERGGLYGYVNSVGQWVLPARYEQAANFRRGKARVLLNGRYMIINRRGQCVRGCLEIAPDVADVAKKVPAETKQERVLRPDERNGRYGFVDGDGYEVIKYKYQNAKPFSDGLAAVCVNGSWGYINQGGSLIIPYHYEAALSFKNGRARVLLDGEWQYIDKSGNRLDY